MIEVRFPKVFHVRCDEAMRTRVKGLGGAHYIRRLVTADAERLAAAAAATAKPGQSVIQKSRGRPRAGRRPGRK